MTGNSSNVEIPSNFSQDFHPGYPPQRRLLQKLTDILGRVVSPAGQDSLENGLSFSVNWSRPCLLVPPAMINPPVIPGYCTFENYNCIAV